MLGHSCGCDPQDSTSALIVPVIEKKVTRLSFNPYNFSKTITSAKMPLHSDFWIVLMVVK